MNLIDIPEGSYYPTESSRGYILNVKGVPIEAYWLLYLKIWRSHKVRIFCAQRVFEFLEQYPEKPMRFHFRILSND